MSATTHNRPRGDPIMDELHYTKQYKTNARFRINDAFLTSLSRRALQDVSRVESTAFDAATFTRTPSSDTSRVGTAYLIQKQIRE